MPCFSQFGGNHQAAQWSKSGESQPLQGSFANIWELKMELRSPWQGHFTHSLQRSCLLYQEKGVTGTLKALFYCSSSHTPVTLCSSTFKLFFTSDKRGHKTAQRRKHFNNFWFSVIPERPKKLPLTSVLLSFELFRINNSIFFSTNTSMAAVELPL